ncbi:MAG: hypothetical protein E7773_03150 [Sphingomonas sp.]|uniref:hypothetical protein n=1 Tax=Sphingomonas sp. TaxID=28214 RepID=UPI00121004B4|nr:hypothetical protein [Sphingomonas sp.]THD37987.1 MAG: hypothetical protein E7773_03150 [Sphingomonas sp.]
MPGERTTTLIRIATALMVLAMLSACAAKLPWTPENVAVVGKKCGLDGINVNDSGLAVSGLSQTGKEPPAAKKIRCLKRRVRVPADFFFLYT